MQFSGMTELEQSLCRMIAREMGFTYPDVRFVFCKTESFDRTLTILRFCKISRVDVIKGLEEVP